MLEASVVVESCISKDILFLLFHYVILCLGAWEKYFPGIRIILADDNVKPVDVIKSL